MENDFNIFYFFLEQKSTQSEREVCENEKKKVIFLFSSWFGCSLFQLVSLIYLTFYLVKYKEISEVGGLFCVAI